MSLEAIMGQLYTLTQPLPGIGHVYTLELSDIQPAEVQAFLGIPDQASPRGWSIRAWQWFRRGFTRTHLDLEGYTQSVVHHIHLVSWWEVNYAQESEREWRTMTDTICDLFTDSLLLYGYAEQFTAPVSVFEGRAVINEIYRCHDVELQVDIMEIINRLPEED